MGRTIIVSNRLPVKIEEKEGAYSFVPSAGGLATGLDSIYRQPGNLWLGWPGQSVPADRQEEVTKELSSHNMSPVFLTEEEIDKFYLGFSNETLWPLCHYFVQNIEFNQDNWKSYVAVNHKFAEAVAEQLEPDDVIWVHDYQLMLVPGMIRKQFPRCTLGFFQHIPFPSYEIFRMLPWRRRLLKGLLGADYIGFHTYDDMRHFLSSVSRLAGISYTRNQVYCKNRLVEADSLPMGIDYDKFHETAKSEATTKRMNRYRQLLGNQRLILSVDRLDYSKGIPQRLEVIEAFFEKYPRYIGKVSLIMVVVPSRDQVPSYQNLKETVDELVGRINSRFGKIGWIPIHYFYRSYPFTSLSAFYRMSDIAMITPMRDGMNLVCKEFVASRVSGDGVLILSEMAGAAKELSDAILVNPNDKKQMVKALHQALQMPLEEQRMHMTLMQEVVKKFNVFNWVKLFFNRLSEVKLSQTEKQITRIDETVAGEIISQYKSAKKRLLLINYDGTLAPYKTNPDSVAPAAIIEKLLREFAADPANHVAIISGRPKHFLDKYFGEIPIELFAEYQIWRKQPGSEWEKIKNPDRDWQRSIFNVMNFYAERTPGARIEQKEYSLVWHYRKVEKGLGELRTRELSSHLRHSIMNKDLEILEGNAILEVKPRSINKGEAAKKVLENYQPDFILAVGDDVSDEDVFENLPERAITLKIGSGTSSARYGLSNHRQFLRFLASLAHSEN